jgi:hypothetical protein
MTPKFMRGEVRHLAEDLIVKKDGVTESERPEARDCIDFALVTGAQHIL